MARTLKIPFICGSCGQAIDVRSRAADAATQIANLKQQAQTQYHLIELNFGNSTSAASIITSVESYQNLAAVLPGTTLGLLGSNSDGEPTLSFANLTTSITSSSPGSLLSTTA